MPARSAIEPLESRIAPASLVVAGSSVLEGNAGVSNLDFTVTLDAVSGDTVTVHYATALDTTGAHPASASDFVATSGDLSFAPGETSKTIHVSINGNTTAQTDRTLLLNLTAPINATITTSSAAGTIIEDDYAITVANTVIAEGDEASNAHTITFTLNKAYATNVSVDYTTSNGSGIAGTDYTATAGTLTFAAGQTSKTISVSTLGNTAQNSDHTFNLDLSNQTSGIALAAAQKTFTILDDDAIISIASASKAEGNAGTSNLVFTVSLGAVAADHDVQVHVKTANGTGTAGTDYTAVDTVVTIPAGTLSAVVNVPITGNTTHQSNRTFTATINSPDTLAKVGTAVGTGTIIDDDPQVSIGAAGLTEGDVGTSDLTFTASLPYASAVDTVVHYTTEDGTAKAGADYTTTTGTVTIPAGSLTATFNVPIIGDAIKEAATETFNVKITSVDNATASSSTAVGTITDNDTISQLTVANLSHSEGPAGSSTAYNFVANLSAAQSVDTTFTFHTADGTATAGEVSAHGDYIAVPSAGVTGLVTIKAGSTSATFTVSVNGDGDAEASEKFFVDLSTTDSHLTIGTTQAVGTILTDDAQSWTKNSVTYLDAAGATVTLQFSKNVFKNAKQVGKLLTFTSTDSSTGAVSLSSINYNALPAAASANLKITAGSSLDDSAHADVGLINATGLHLGKIKIDGDLGQINAKTIDALRAYSMGVRGLTSGALNTISTITGNIGNLKIMSDLNVAQLAVNTLGKGNIKSLFIGGNIIGGAATGSGSITFAGRIGSAVISGQLLGGAGDGSGSILGFVQSFSSIGSVSAGTIPSGPVLDVLKGGGGVDSGEISAYKIGSSILNGNIAGGNGVASGLLQAVNMGATTIHGSITGSTTITSGFSGVLFGGTFSGPVVIDGNIVGGSGVKSGYVEATSMTKLTVGGNIVGGTGHDNGEVFVRDINSLTVNGSIIGGTSLGAGSVLVSGKAKNITIGSGTGDALVGGSAESAGSLAVTGAGTVASITIKGNVHGGTALNAGSINSSGSVKSLNISGNIQGGTALGAGSVSSAGTIENMTVGGSLLGGSGESSGDIAVNVLGNLAISGGITGSSGVKSGRVSAQTSIALVTVGAAGITGGTAADSGQIISSGELERVEVTGGLTGGTANGTGTILADNGTIKLITIGGDVTGGNSGSDSDSPLKGSGLIEAAHLLSVNITGSLIAGTKGVADIFGSGAIRSGFEIGAIAIHGSIVGNATNAAYITAIGQLNPASAGFLDTAIGSLTVDHEVTRANILAGYSDNASAAPSPLNADASIGTIDIGGTLTASNIIAGAMTGGTFGDGTDATISGTGVRDIANVIATIGKITVGVSAGGTDANDAETFAIVADAITSVTINSLVLSLAPGSNNDVFPGIAIGATPGTKVSDSHDFHVFELP